MRDFGQLQRQPGRRPRLAARSPAGRFDARLPKVYNIWAMPLYFHPEQINRILSAAAPGRDRLLLTLLWRSGLRVSEALSLTGADVRLAMQPPQLRVRRGKGGKARLVPVHPELAAMLAAVAMRPDRRLFDCSRRTAAYVAEAAIAKAGVEPWGLADGARKAGCHSLRHSAARHWLASGVPVNQVSAWLGHSNPLTTLRIYERLSADDLGHMGNIV